MAAGFGGPRQARAGPSRDRLQRSLQADSSSRPYWDAGGYSRCRNQWHSKRFAQRRNFCHPTRMTEVDSAGTRRSQVLSSESGRSEAQLGLEPGDYESRSHCSSQLPALQAGRPGGQRTFTLNVLQFTPCGVYLWLESRAEIINVSYRMDSVIAPARPSQAPFKFQRNRRRVESTAAGTGNCCWHYRCFHRRMPGGTFCGFRLNFS